VRASFSGRRHARAGGGRGTGTVKVTGSYEGSLPTEGTSDHHAPSLFTRRWARWSRRLSPTETGARRRTNTFRGREGRDRGVRGTIAPGKGGKKTPPRVRVSIRRSGLGCRETSGPPVSRTEPKTPWGVHAVKAASRTGNARGTGSRQSFRWQKSVVRIARFVRREVASPRGGNQGASQEEARSPV
jgi:hypothetical protein